MPRKGNKQRKFNIEVQFLGAG
jgi:hypothetical protein